ncbi:hypothetical protein HY417_02765 [Candidatus Kaiserbacteria bacterium]|nr:hypothetical protein [Candidatus Kaiserbacteria bacterium]
MIEKIEAWLFVLVALAVAVLGNYIGATWASKDDKMSLWLLALFIVSPLVFITFGLVTTRFGVAVGSGTLDALLTISTVALGLFVFHEWDTLSVYQYVGLFLVVAGIILMQFASRPLM